MDPFPAQPRLSGAWRKAGRCGDDKRYFARTVTDLDQQARTAQRLRQRIRTVLDWARAAGHRSGDNPVDLIGDALPRRIDKTEHHEALHYEEVGEFLKRLRASQAHTNTKVAFEFMILTAARTTEVRTATWSEIDFGKALWIVPSDE